MSDRGPTDEAADPAAERRAAIIRASQQQMNPQNVSQIRHIYADVPATDPINDDQGTGAPNGNNSDGDDPTGADQDGNDQTAMIKTTRTGSVTTSAATIKAGDNQGGGVARPQHTDQDHPG